MNIDLSKASRQHSYAGKLGKSSQVLGRPPPPELGKIKTWERYEKIPPPFWEMQELGKNGKK